MFFMGKENVSHGHYLNFPGLIEASSARREFHEKTVKLHNFIWKEWGSRNKERREALLRKEIMRREGPFEETIHLSLGCGLIFNGKSHQVKGGKLHNWSRKVWTIPEWSVLHLLLQEWLYRPFPSCPIFFFCAEKSSVIRALWNKKVFKFLGLLSVFFYFSPFSQYLITLGGPAFSLRSGITQSLVRS